MILMGRKALLLYSDSHALKARIRRRIFAHIDRVIDANAVGEHQALCNLVDDDRAGGAWTVVASLPAWCFRSNLIILTRV